MLPHHAPDDECRDQRLDQNKIWLRSLQKQNPNKLLTNKKLVKIILTFKIGNKLLRVKFFYTFYSNLRVS